MWQLYRVRRTSRLLLELEKALKSAAELWLESVQSPTSSYLDLVPLNPIHSLVEVSSAGTGAENSGPFISDSPFGVGVRCPGVLITSTSESFD